MTEKSKLVGETEESVIVLFYELDEKDVSFTGHEFSKDSLIENEEDGEQRAREYLEEGELWKMSVEDDRTTMGLDEWIEDVINMDGWEEVIGDIFETKNNKYIQLTSGGQIDMDIKPEHFVKYFIPKQDLEFIFKCWTKFHMKPIQKVPKETIERLNKIFEQQTDIEDWDSEEK